MASPSHGSDPQPTTSWQFRENLWPNWIHMLFAAKKTKCWTLPKSQSHQFYIKMFWNSRATKSVYQPFTSTNHISKFHQPNRTPPGPQPCYPNPQPESFDTAGPAASTLGQKNNNSDLLMSLTAGFLADESFFDCLNLHLEDEVGILDKFLAIWLDSGWISDKFCNFPTKHPTF